MESEAPNLSALESRPGGLTVIQLIKRFDSRNTGDRMADPQLYFSFSSPIREVCLHELFETQSFDPHLPSILGGGGLDYWRGKVQQIAKSRRERVVTWGMGLNRHFTAWDDEFPAWYDTFDLNGVRDHSRRLPYVPCVSCLHPAFRERYPVTREVVAYEHFSRPLGLLELPSLDNSAGFAEVVRFLGSAETVITNTYHGAYWATLLGKRVAVFPLEGSSRFYFMKHPPVFSTLEDWRGDLQQAQAYPESLAECVQLNLDHAARVAERLDVQILPR